MDVEEYLTRLEQMADRHEARARQYRRALLAQEAEDCARDGIALRWAVCACRAAIAAGVLSAPKVRRT